MIIDGKKVLNKHKEIHDIKVTNCTLCGCSFPYYDNYNKPPRHCNKCYANLNLGV